MRYRMRRATITAFLAGAAHLGPAACAIWGIDEVTPGDETTVEAADGVSGGVPAQPTTGNVTIKPAAGAATTATTGTATAPTVPISAKIFDGSPGPKSCRGRVMMDIQLPKPGSRHATPTCHNMPSSAECATFTANEEDGCQARLFAEKDCVDFTNLAVFMPEERATGGYWMSIEVTCGIKSVVPAPLQLPGLQMPVEHAGRTRRGKKKKKKAEVMGTHDLRSTDR